MGRRGKNLTPEERNVIANSIKEMVGLSQTIECEKMDALVEKHKVCRRSINYIFVDEILQKKNVKPQKTKHPNQ